MTEPYEPGQAPPAYVDARNPAYASADETIITLEVAFTGLGGGQFVPFSVTADAEGGYEAELYARAVAGDFGEIAAYTQPTTPVPLAITRRQAAKELFARALITGPEMVAMAASGAAPSPIATTANGMATPQRWHALVELASDPYRRDNTLLMSLLSPTIADLDDFFRTASQIS